MKPVDQLSDADLERLARRAIALPDAPASLIDTAVGLWRAAAPSQAPAGLREAVRRVVAALRFDSWASAPLAAGVRSLPSDVRHLLFSASGRDVDLRIVPVANRFTLSGQVLGPDESGSVELVDEAATALAPSQPRVATLDELGAFTLDDVPSGTYQLTLRVGNDDIVLPPIDVGHR